MVAYLLGTQSANWTEAWRLAWNADTYHAQAAQLTEVVLRKMGTINVGDTLANFSFEDIDGKMHRLSELVIDKTLITYLRPDCDACLEELERLRNAAHGPGDYEHVLLITSANPLHLQKLRRAYGLGCVMLYDEERYFGAALKIQSFPFNLVVNSSRVIEEIHANMLLPDDYERFFEEIRGRDVETSGVSTYGSNNVALSLSKGRKVTKEQHEKPPDRPFPS